MQWYVTRSLDHNLDIVLVGNARQFSQCVEFIELGFIICISDTSRTQTIPEAYPEIVLPRDVENLVVGKKEGVLLSSLS